MSARLTELRVCDSPQDWKEVGFDIDEHGVLHLPGLRICFGRCTHGASLGFSGGNSESVASLDGIHVHHSDELSLTCGNHPNGVKSVDHVVVRTQDWKATQQAFENLGVPLRRQTENVRLGVKALFYRSEQKPSPVIEVVAQTSEEPHAVHSACLWGITFTSSDIDQTHHFLAHHTAPPWPAVQKGRRITTLKNGEGLGVNLALAFISPHIHDTDKGAHRDAEDAKRARAQEKMLAQFKRESPARL
mmetsp:Transcript_45518/g.97578  ORF Transcript_45518/g.97578 Transcript_45518/m.97578 type:complete len:246 (+) Transcript_45518:309-1046(+)